MSIGGVFDDTRGFVAYEKHLAIRSHFTLDSYDYFKYNGKVRTSKEVFQRQRDKYHYNKLYGILDYDKIILANVLNNPKTWVGEMLDESSGIRIFNEWRRRTSAFTYNLKTDLSQLDETDFKSNFVIRDGKTPLILKAAMQKKISIETLSVMMFMTKTSQYMRERLDDKYIALPLVVKAEKYHPFIDYDKKKVEDIVSDYFFI